MQPLTITGPFPEKLFGALAAKRLFTSPEVQKNIIDFLPKRTLYVGVEHSMAVKALIENLIFAHPDSANFEGRTFAIHGRNIIPGQIDPYVSPTVFATHPRQVTYEHRLFVLTRFPSDQVRIRQHVILYGIDSVIFKGQVHLHRGIGRDGYGNSGPYVVSRRSEDQCVLHLPTVNNWLLGSEFSMRDFMDGHWSLHFVKGFFLQVTEPRVGRTMMVEGVLHLDINWGYGS